MKMLLLPVVWSLFNLKEKSWKDDVFTTASLNLPTVILHTTVRETNAQQAKGEFPIQWHLSLCICRTLGARQIALYCALCQVLAERGSNCSKSIFTWNDSGVANSKLTPSLMHSNLS